MYILYLLTQKISNIADAVHQRVIDSDWMNFHVVFFRVVS